MARSNMMRVYTEEYNVDGRTVAGGENPKRKGTHGDIIATVV